MGGEATKVDADTTSLLLEAASFHPARVRRTAARLGLRPLSGSKDVVRPRGRGPPGEHSFSSGRGVVVPAPRGGGSPVMQGIPPRGVTPARAPTPGVELVMGDVSTGSVTPSMVRKVLAWKAGDEAERGSPAA